MSDLDDSIRTNKARPKLEFRQNWLSELKMGPNSHPQSKQINLFFWVLDIKTIKIKNKRKLYL